MKKTALVLLLVSAAAGLLQAQSNYTPMVTLRRPLVNIGAVSYTHLTLPTIA